MNLVMITASLVLIAILSTANSAVRSKSSCINDEDFKDYQGFDKKVASPFFYKEVTSSSNSTQSDVFGRKQPVPVLTRNIFFKGKYPVALRDLGPPLDKRIPVTISHIRVPVQIKPTIYLPCNIPKPKVISHTCTCYKTVYRPVVHDHYITVPTVQRYVETLHQPVVENIHYEACPLNCGIVEDETLPFENFEFPIDFPSYPVARKYPVRRYPNKRKRY